MEGDRLDKFLIVSFVVSVSLGLILAAGLAVGLWTSLLSPGVCW